MHPFRTAVAAAALATATAASAQSFNVDFGLGLQTPSPSFAGAGLPGFWNPFAGAGFESFSPDDLQGNPTDITVSSPYFATQLTSFSPSALTAPNPDHAALFDDFFFMEGDSTHDFTISGLENGLYDLVLYGIWVENPDEPTSFFWIDSALDDFRADITGDEPYTGQLVEGVTHTVFRDLPVTDGTLTFTAFGVFNLQIESFGTFNGFQLVQIPAPAPAALLAAAPLALTRRRR